MPTIHLKYGVSTQDVIIPDSRLAGVLEPNPCPAIGDQCATIEAALSAPIGTPRLAELVSGRRHVAVVVSDVTRPAPTAKMLGPLLAELNQAGVADDRITVVFATGIHRTHTSAEQAALLGSAYGRVRCVDSAGAHGREANMTFVGSTKRGTPIMVDSVVAEADVRIATGNVEYHYFAGYSGGAKALVPGVCSKSTIEHNHGLMVQPGAAAGHIGDNPVRQDLEEAGAMIGIDFCLNTVLNGKREIVAAYAGLPNAVLRHASRMVDQTYGVTIPETADIVVASAGGHPKDINLYQAQKALDNARFAARRGGTLILAAECQEGFGEPTFEQWITAASSPEALVARIQREFVLGGHKAAAIALVLQQMRVYLVSALPDQLVRQMFMEPAPTVQAAVDVALADAGAAASVLVIPNAGSVVPRLARAG
ncbi:MAG TPA: nickel-dependent lactate racemase [Chloroflexota bacterium]|nr:nickel-dependent lactate racemase [Chloroflexota bacterium]